MLSNQNLLILGLGNVLLGDEGVGIHIINGLKKKLLPDCVSIIDGGTMGLSLIDTISGYQETLVVDAVRGESLPDLRFFSLKEIISKENERNNFSLHSVGFDSVLKLMDTLELKVPDITVLGIRIDEISPGIGLSSQCGKVVSRAVTMIMEKINDYRRKYHVR